MVDLLGDLFRLADDTPAPTPMGTHTRCVGILYEQQYFNQVVNGGRFPNHFINSLFLLLMSICQGDVNNFDVQCKCD